MKGSVRAKKTMTFHLMRIVVMPLVIASAMLMVVHGAERLPKVTVSQSNSSAMPADVTFSYLLEPSKSDNPMPSGSTEKGFTLTLNGNKATELIFSENIRAGYYLYEMSQVVEGKRPGVVYDQRSYRIELLIDEKKEATLIVSSGEGLKVKEIIFENGFKQAVNPPPKEDPRPVPQTPPLPVKPTVPGKGSLTGDGMNFWLEIVGIVAASSLVVIVAAARKKNSRKERDLTDL